MHNVLLDVVPNFFFIEMLHCDLNDLIIEYLFYGFNALLIKNPIES